ncbi:MAG: DUF3313 domain-containing protein [Verrucomicrobiia bacterium]
MKTSSQNETGSNRRWQFLTGVLAAGMALGLTACATTHQTRSVTESGFLKDYSLLSPGPSDGAKLAYVDSWQNWAQFTKVDIEPVTLWHSDDPDSKLGKLDKEDQQMLVNFFHTALKDALSKDYEITDKPGPGVLVIHAAITEAKPSRPVADLVSSVVPFGMAASLVKRVIFGTGLGVGECQVEAEFIDGGNGKIVAEAVDRRAGTKALRTKFDGSYGDIKLCMDYWAARCAFKLEKLRIDSADETEM